MEIDSDCDIDFDKLQEESQLEIDSQPDLIQLNKYNASPFKDRTLQNVQIPVTEEILTGPIRKQHQNDFDITHNQIKD